MDDGLLTRAVAEVVVERGLRERLAGGRPLRLKQGFDPTRPQMHVGHTVGLRKLRAFQELGHQVVLVVGDWTAQIGDPSGRDQSRQRLDAETVRQNAETYMQQFFSVVDRERTEVRWQSEWYGALGLEHALALAGRFTLARLLAHETFRRRHEAGAPVTLLELMYPILQAYDSVAVRADVEIGGTDQRFNILAGRELMSQMGMAPQEVLLVPLIPGTDGRKMSKSFGNTVDITMAPLEQYSRVMALGDGALPLLFETLTDAPLAEIEEMRRGLAAGTADPMAMKQRLARFVVAQFHPGAAEAAEAEWVRRFSRREAPRDAPDHLADAPVRAVDLLVAAGLAPSRSEARRLVAAGAVYAGERRVAAPDDLIDPEGAPIVRVGRRRFVRLVRPRG